MGDFLFFIDLCARHNVPGAQIFFYNKKSPYNRETFLYLTNYIIIKSCMPESY